MDTMVKITNQSFGSGQEFSLLANGVEKDDKIVLV
jgi:hypothetical protein